MSTSLKRCLLYCYVRLLLLTALKVIIIGGEGGDHQPTCRPIHTYTQTVSSLAIQVLSLSDLDTRVRHDVVDAIDLGQPQANHPSSLSSLPLLHVFFVLAASTVPHHLLDDLACGLSSSPMT